MNRTAHPLIHDIPQSLSCKAEAHEDTACCDALPDKLTATLGLEMAEPCRTAMAWQIVDRGFSAAERVELSRENRLVARNN
jgi:hypothetical protein